MIEAGVSRDAEVTVVASATKPNETTIRTTVGGLGAAIRRGDVSGCAMILVSLPRDAGAGRRATGTVSLMAG